MYFRDQNMLETDICLRNDQQEEKQIATIIFFLSTRKNTDLIFIHLGV